MSADYELEKLVWTEADFEDMGWHDATIHGIAFLEDTYELALDLDYMFQWVEPEEGETYYKFWISPVTLVFENVHAMKLDVDSPFGLEIAGIGRGEPTRPENAEAIRRDTQWIWEIDCQEGLIAFKSTGYKMFVRAKPVLHRHQSLDRAPDGGVCFDRSYRDQA